MNEQFALLIARAYGRSPINILIGLRPTYPYPDTYPDPYPYPDRIQTVSRNLYCSKFAAAFAAAGAYNKIYLYRSFLTTPQQQLQ